MTPQVTLIPALGDNYIYLISSGTKACVIDPADASPVFEQLDSKGLKLEQILTTHHHSDHVLGNLPLKEKTGCTIVGPEDKRVPGLDQSVHEGSKVSFDSIEFEVLFVPGHTSTHIAYFAPNEKWLFSGDSLFTGGCGRLLEGTAEEMLGSLRKIETLPDDTLVYCGHEYTENNLKFAQSLEPQNQEVAKRLDDVRELRKQGKPSIPSHLFLEKKTNPFLRSSNETLRKAIAMSGASDLEVFAHIRSLKDQF